MCVCVCVCACGCMCASCGCCCCYDGEPVAGVSLAMIIATAEADGRISFVIIFANCCAPWLCYYNTPAASNAAAAAAGADAAKEVAADRRILHAVRFLPKLPRIIAVLHASGLRCPALPTCPRALRCVTSCYVFRYVTTHYTNTMTSITLQRF